MFAPKTVSVGDLFTGALLPGLLLAGLYGVYVLIRAGQQRRVPPSDADALPARPSAAALAKGLLAPLALIVAVLGSILFGVATPTEAAGVGALGALLLAGLNRALTRAVLRQVCQATLNTTAMVFFILIGASVFSLVFRGLGGDQMVHGLFMDMPGGQFGALAVVMLVIFLLGFILDFIEITFVVVPMVGPVLLAMGIDPIWLGVLLAANLQTSFLTPPFGFALFYLRGVAPPEVKTLDLYRGAIPFVGLQLLLLALLFLLPELATWLPEQLYGGR